MTTRHIHLSPHRGCVPKERELPLLCRADDIDDGRPQQLIPEVAPHQQQPPSSPHRTSCIRNRQTLFALETDEHDNDDISVAAVDHHERTASEWPLQHLAILEQLETEYDQALLKINVDLRAKLYWIRYSAGFSVIFVLVYLIVGILFFMQLADLTLSQAIFFSVYTMTATGYGCYGTPHTNLFLTFQIFYILIGIAALAIMAAQVFQYLAYETTLAQQALDKTDLARRGLDLLSQSNVAGQISEDRRTSLQSTIKFNRHGEPRELQLFLLQKWNVAKKYFRSTCTGRILSVVLPLFIILLSGGLIVGTIENWTLLESIYFAVVSMTTVGYGDFVPTKTSSTIITAIWLPWSIVFLSIYMGSVASWYLDLSSKTMKRIENDMRQQAEKQGELKQETCQSSSSKIVKENYPVRVSSICSDAHSMDDLACVSSSELFGAPGQGSGTVRRDSILQLKTVSELNPWTHEGQAMATMADVLLSTHAKLDALVSRQSEESEAPPSDEVKEKPQGIAPDFLVLRTNSSMSERALNTTRPALELRLIVLERLAAIIATEVTGIASSIEIRHDTLSITLNNLKQIARKWLIPSSALKAFRSVSFKCLYFIGEHALITQGVAALLELSPVEFHKLFHPLLAAMGDTEILETWLASTEVMAAQHNETAMKVSKNGHATSENASAQFKIHQHFTVQDSMVNFTVHDAIVNISALR